MDKKKFKEDLKEFKTELDNYIKSTSYCPKCYTSKSIGCQCVPFKALEILRDNYDDLMDL